MSKTAWSLCIVVASGLAFSVVSARAAGEGQDDLDKATEAKLSAETVSDLGEVIRLGESSLKKGLDDENTAFAKAIVAAALIQRGSTAANAIFKGQPPANWAQYRDLALADLEKAVKYDPKQTEAYLLVAQLNMLPDGDAKKAREAVDKAIELSGDEPAVRAKMLVLRASMQESLEKRLPDLDEAVRLAPGFAAAVRARGLLKADLGKLEESLADLEKAIELEPEDTATYEAKAIVLARLKKYDESLSALEKARKLSPESVSPLVQQARVHSQQEMPAAALDDLSRALKIDPDNIAVLLLRAGVYQEMGEKEKAMLDADQAVKLRPNLPLAIRTRALLLADSDKTDEAVQELEKLRKIEPKDLLTLLQLGMLYEVQKQSEKSIEAYTALLGRGARGVASLARTRRHLPELRQAGRGHRRLQQGPAAATQGQRHPQQPRLGAGHLAGRQTPRREAGDRPWPPRPAK